jgi:hypothetical protein
MSAYKTGTSTKKKIGCQFSTESKFRSASGDE